MTQTTKRRGRPAGTDYKQDKIALELVAERMMSEPRLKPTQAMRAVFDSEAFKGRGYTQRDTTVARWLVKWKSAGPAALASAKEQQTRNLPLAPSFGSPFGLARMQCLSAPPSADLLRRIESASRAIEQFERSGGRAALEARSSSARQIAEGWVSNLDNQSIFQMVSSARAAMRAVQDAGGVSRLLASAREAQAALKARRGF